MAQFLGGAPITLNGQTWVEVVAAPASGKQRQILAVIPRNLDSVQHTYEGRKLKGATPYDLGSPIFVQAGKGGDYLASCVVLAAVDESFQMRTADVTITTESKVDVSVFEVP